MPVSLALTCQRTPSVAVLGERDILLDDHEIEGMRRGGINPLVKLESENEYSCLGNREGKVHLTRRKSVRLWAEALCKGIPVLY